MTTPSPAIGCFPFPRPARLSPRSRRRCGGNPPNISISFRWNSRGAQPSSPGTPDITADHPANKRIIGFSTEAPEKYVPLIFGGDRRGKLSLLLEFLRNGLPLPEWTDKARLEEEGKVGL